MPDIAISISIHAAPVRAVASPTISGPLHLYFDKSSGYPDVTLFTGSLALAADLATAINGVLERHRQAPAEAADRAEQLILAPAESAL